MDECFSDEGRAAMWAEIRQLGEDLIAICDSPPEDIYLSDLHDSIDHLQYYVETYAKPRMRKP